MFSATALFRDFNSVITSRGYKDSSGGVSDIYYYTEKDGLDYFSPGEKTSFYTLFSEYEFKIEHNLGWSLVGFGFKYKKAGSPMVVDLSYEGVSDSHDGSILMYTENRSYELLISSKYLSRIWGDLYWQYYVPVSIAFMNVSENSYFKKRSYPLGASSVGSIALTYLLSHLKIEAGVDYAMYWSMLMLQDVKLKEGITFLDKFDGSTVTVPAGSKMDMNLSRLEFFWGFYVNAAVYF